MTQPSIRTRCEQDDGRIDEILRKAFKTDAEARLTKMLRSDGAAVMEFVAQDQDLIVGCVMMSRMATPDRCLGLGPIAVDPEYQHSGIGAAMMRHCIESASDWRAIFLLGAPAYYERFGFSASAAASFDSGFPKPNFMALEIEERGLEGLGPTVAYAQPFYSL